MESDAFEKFVETQVNVEGVQTRIKMAEQKLQQSMAEIERLKKVRAEEKMAAGTTT